VPGGAASVANMDVDRPLPSPQTPEAKPFCDGLRPRVLLPAHPVPQVPVSRHRPDQSAADLAESAPLSQGAQKLERLEHQLARE